MPDQAIVFAAIAPHGAIAIPELCSDDERRLAAATTAGLEELGRRFADAAPESVVVLTPHTAHVPGAIAVVVAGAHTGSLAGADGAAIELTCPCDRELALAVLGQLWLHEVPAVGLSFGGNDPSAAVMPMDWGTLIPLWFMGGRAEEPAPTVVVGPARDLSAADHARAGRAIAEAAAGKRVALIASADHGHAHDPDGPYGFNPAAAEYDARMTKVVSENRLDTLLDIDPAFVDAAKADSWWQLLMLHGAVEGAFEVELLSYEAPTYFGMLCAAFSPAA
jgi:aromatic ring-opening dioxygenase LigB subunit